MVNPTPIPEGLPPPYEPDDNDTQSAPTDALLQREPAVFPALPTPPERPFEQMQIEEPDSQLHAAPSTALSSTFESSQRFLTSKIIAPVHKIFIDPISQLYRTLSIKFDIFISRYGNPLILKRLLYLVFVFIFIFIAFEFGILPGDAFGGGSTGSGEYHDRESLNEFLKATISQDEIRDRLEYLASMPHLSGTAGDLALAKYVQEEMLSFGLPQVGLSEHSTYITFPNETDTSTQLDLLINNNIEYSASLKEDMLYENPTDSQVQPKPYLAFSGSGDVRGPLVYVNYGTKTDLKYLRDNDISLEGAIVIMRNGKMSTGLKVSLVEAAGAVGVITFSDRLQDSILELWPNGPDYPEGGVERDSLSLTAISPGDILTPGYSSVGTNKVSSVEEIKTLPKIPAVPASWRDVRPFLEALKSVGVSMPGSDIPQISEWWSGNATTGSAEAHLVNYPVVKERHPIWNVVGKMIGVEQKELAVIIGARRDSFCYGAAGSMSGTTVLLEIARVLSLMSKKYNWSPLRSIYFASWDGTGQNLAGTTEWVEYNSETLREEGVVYINLDEAISGNGFHAEGHPMLTTVLKQVLATVQEPATNETMSTDFTMPPFKDFGDYTPFMSYAGIASLELSFRGKKFPKNSCFDSVEWMKKYGDADFSYHRTLTEIIGKLTLRLVDDAIIPFDMGTYAESLDAYTDDLARYCATQESWTGNGDAVVNFDALHSAAQAMKELFRRFILWRTDWVTVIGGGNGEPIRFMEHRWNWNVRMMMVDKLLLQSDSDAWYKHQVYGMQLWHPTDVPGFLYGTFPSVRDAAEVGDWARVQRAIEKTASDISVAVSKLL